MAVAQRTGRLNSGDVSLFYRVFGSPGATPIIILHGSNYYDSYDWINVATALAADREVVVHDKRGWGESTWSPSKDYSYDAFLDDALAVIGTMRWPKVIVMAHSGGGPTSISFAVNFQDRTEKLVLIDSQMNREEAARTGSSVGNPPLVFPSIEAAMENFAKINNPPRFGLDRERAVQALIKLENGYMLKRDPDNGNARPIGEGAELPRRPPSDVWKDFAALTVPTILVRGLKSDRWDNPAVLERLTRDHAKLPIVTVNSQHDVPDQDPEGLIAHVRKFVGTS
jgi:esterase